VASADLIHSRAEYSSSPLRSPWTYDDQLLPRIREVVTEAAIVGLGARLVALSATREPQVLAAVGCAHLPWSSLVETVVESGQPQVEFAAVAAPITMAHDTIGALVLYCDPEDIAMRANQLQVAHAFAAHVVTLLTASRDHLAGMEAAAAGVLGMLSAYDPASARHSRIVSRLVRALGLAIGLRPSEILTLELGALLHDVGKIAVPIDILRKDGPLSIDEWTIIRGHPAIGERIVREVPGLADTTAAVRHHHERWDGAGYPDRLQGAAIPLHARLIGLADAYEVIRVGRPYRAPRSPEDTVLELRGGIGRQFDPQLSRLLGVLSAVDLVP
jgi:HD-GYP domain-containing protein (c-di-GMP phosphodiesterase class II)